MTENQMKNKGLGDFRDLVKKNKGLGDFRD